MAAYTNAEKAKMEETQITRLNLTWDLAMIF